MDIRKACQVLALARCITLDPKEKRWGALIKLRDEEKWGYEGTAHLIRQVADGMIRERFETVRHEQVMSLDEKCSY